MRAVGFSLPVLIVAGAVAVLSGAVALLGGAVALADIAPLPPQPPPPSGPSSADIRGLKVEQSYTYWRGRRWMTVVTGCDAGQPACAGQDLYGCFIIELGGQRVDGGDVAGLVQADTENEGAPLALTLENCKATTALELAPTTPTAGSAAD